MMTIHGVYDGKSFQALPNQRLPIADREIPVTITFLEDDVALRAQRRQHLVPLAQRMLAIREAMLPLGRSTKALVEEGREH